MSISQWEWLSSCLLMFIDGERGKAIEDWLRMMETLMIVVEMWNDQRGKLSISQNSQIDDSFHMSNDKVREILFAALP